MAQFKRNPKRSFREAEESSVNVFMLVVALAAITLTCFLIYALVQPILFGDERIEIIPFGADEPTTTPPPTIPPTATPAPTLAATFTPQPTPVPQIIRPGNAGQLTQIASLPDHSAPVSSVSYSPDGRFLGSGDWDGVIQIWDAATLTSRLVLQSDSNRVDSLAFSPDGATLIAGGQDAVVRRWNLATGEALEALTSPAAAVRAVAYSPNGQWIAAASDDGFVYLWNAATGELEALLGGHTSYVTSVAFDPESAIVAAGSEDDTIRMWSVPSGIEVATLRGHTSTVTGVAFSPDGTLLASVGADQSVRLWSVLSASPVAELEAHTENLTSVAFSPDGQLLAIGGGGISDNSARVWSMPDRAELRAVTTGGPVNAVDFSPDGMQLAVGGATFLSLWGVGGQAAPQVQAETTVIASPAPTQPLPAGEGGEAAMCTLTVRQQEATVRGAPNDTADVVTSLPQGQRVAATAWARGGDGYTWWLLANGGWVRGDAFLDAENPAIPADCGTLPPVEEAGAQAVAPASGAGAVAASPAATVRPGACALTVQVVNANVRAGPDTTYDVQRQLAQGEQVEAVGWTTGAEGFTWWQLAGGGWARGDVFAAESLAPACLELPRVTP